MAEDTTAPAAKPARRCTDAEKVKKGDRVRFRIPLNGTGFEITTAEVVSVDKPREDEDLPRVALCYETKGGEQEREAVPCDSGPGGRAGSWMPFAPEGKKKG